MKGQIADKLNTEERYELKDEDIQKNLDEIKNM